MWAFLFSLWFLWSVCQPMSIRWTNQKSQVKHVGKGLGGIYPWLGADFSQHCAPLTCQLAHKNKFWEVMHATLLLIPHYSPAHFSEWCIESWTQMDLTYMYLLASICRKRQHTHTHRLNWLLSHHPSSSGGPIT